MAILPAMDDGELERQILRQILEVSVRWRFEPLNFKLPLEKINKAISFIAYHLFIYDFKNSLDE